MIYGFLVHQNGVSLFGPTTISDEPGGNNFNVGLNCVPGIPVILTISGLEGLPAGKVLKVPFKADGVYPEGGALHSEGILTFQGVVEERMLFFPTAPVSVVLSGEVYDDSGSGPSPLSKSFASYGGKGRRNRGRVRKKRF